MIKISPFSGMFPKISDKLLPSENATLAEQCDLESGSLRPARGLRQEVNLGAGLGSVFRTPEGDWMRWPAAGVNAVVSPINDDQYKRVYWTGDGAPKMASHDMAFGGDPAPAAFYPLGIPALTSAPVATGSVLDCPEPEPPATNYQGEVLANGYIVAGQMPNGDWIAVAPASQRAFRFWISSGDNNSNSTLPLFADGQDTNTGKHNTDELVALSQPHEAALYARSQGGDLPSRPELEVIYQNRNIIDAADGSAAGSSYSFASLSESLSMASSSTRFSSTNPWTKVLFDTYVSFFLETSGDNTFQYVVIPSIRLLAPQSDPQPDPTPDEFDFIPEWDYQISTACEQEIYDYIQSDERLGIEGAMLNYRQGSLIAGSTFNTGSTTQNTLKAVYEQLLTTVSDDDIQRTFSSCNLSPDPTPPLDPPSTPPNVGYTLPNPCQLPPGAIEVSAVYVVTFVSEFGEEGPPSPPSEIVTRWDGANSSLSNLPVSDRPNITRKRIYRAETSGTYLLVDEIPNSQTSYTDTKKTLDLGEPLKSMDWDEPDPRMIGLTYIGNGILAGWFENTLCFCEPYRPHAWPIGYQYGFNADIVGIAPIGGGLVVATKSSPWLVTGSMPSAMTQSRLDYHLGSASRESVVDMGEYAVYASSEGLIAVAGREAVNMTQAILTRDQWRAYQPEQVHGYRWHERYLGLYPGGAFILHKEQGLIHYPLSGIIGGWQDPFTGEVFLFDAAGNVSAWFEGGVLPYRWVSRIFSLPQKASCNTFKIDGEQRRNNPVQLRVYADGKVLYGKRLTNDEALRLPAGRYRDYQVELTGTAEVLSVQLTFNNSELL